MSWQAAADPSCEGSDCSPIEMVIVPRARDIGDFEVRRALPSAQKRLVGPFVFFDQMGPAEFLLGRGIDVRPHPHIGLSTVTYLFDGAILHRDSLGTKLKIEPGAVNWMTAGSGITHSERTAEEDRRAPQSLFGIQTWVALPKAFEDTAPAFFHHGRDELPATEAEGKSVRVILGAAYGLSSPVRTHSAMFYVDAALAAGAVLPLDPDYDERAIYVVSGEIEIAGDVFGAAQLLVFKPGDRISVTARSPSRLMLLGGEPMDGQRYVWWNFVSSDPDRIEQAKADWKAGRFAAVPDDDEFIPLPER